MGRQKLTDEEKALRKQQRELEKQSKTDKDARQRLELTDMLKSLYEAQGETVNYPMVMSQCKNYIEQYGYNYGSIRYTLWYMINIKEINLFSDKNYNGSVLNLVPYYYDEAKKYCEDSIKIRDNFKNFDFDKREPQVAKVNVNRQRKLLHLTFDNF